MILSLGGQGLCKSAVQKNYLICMKHVSQNSLALYSCSAILMMVPKRKTTFTLEAKHEMNKFYEEGMKTHKIASKIYFLCL